VTDVYLDTLRAGGSEQVERAMRLDLRFISS
jgi:hypothetical protein